MPPSVHEGTAVMSPSSMEDHRGHTRIPQQDWLDDLDRSAFDGNELCEFGKAEPIKSRSAVKIKNRTAFSYEYRKPLELPRSSSA